MAIRTLMGVKRIGGFAVIDMNELKKEKPEVFRPDGSMHYEVFEKEIRPHNFIYVRHDVNSLSFTLQSGPVKEVGVNGCQVDTVIEAAKLIVEGLNKEVPCEENEFAIGSLKKALVWLETRRNNRIRRGVEGTSQQ